MAFIDRLKDAYITAEKEVKRRRQILYDAETDDNFNALFEIEMEQIFIKNQFKANGFDLDQEASSYAKSITAAKCSFCNTLFEEMDKCKKHILDEHVLEMVKVQKVTS